MSRTHVILALAAAAAVVFWIGRSTAGGGGAQSAGVQSAGVQSAGVQSAGVQNAGAQDAGAQAAEAGPVDPSLHTCPMHAQIKLPDPGDCPICGMDLVPMARGGDDHPRRLAMSSAAKELARIETAAVRRKIVTRSVRLVGKVDYDETAVQTISAWVSGRLDRLFVDYTGVPVNKGDHLVRLYSPELSTAQEELLSAAHRLEESAGEASSFLRESNQRAYEVAREKLLLLGLTEAQLEEIEERGTADDFVMLTSPSSGVVIEKPLDQGAYVQTGTPIYRVADLDSLWVLLDAYEKDLAWLRAGQPLVLGVEALPGEDFRGTIAFIDPFIDERTRTAKVRVNIDNSDRRLKPGMFVTGVAAARLGAGGRVADRYLAGKWVSPMHPEIVKDGPGTCDVCGMALVRAEDLGLVAPDVGEGEPPLVVPASAVLVTGKRAVAYVQVPATERPTYEGREVVLGPRAGDEYVVLSGLEEGERVVVHGAFRIDSAMQILAKPSMMSGAAERIEVHGPEGVAFRRSLHGVYGAYLELQAALAADDEAAARAALEALAEALADPSAAGLPAGARAVWRDERARMDEALARARRADGIEGVRAAFEDGSRAALRLAATFGHDLDDTLVEAFCPMAFDDRGASWLQVEGEIANPYFGAEMLRCGEAREAFAPAGTHGHAAPEDR